MEKKEKMKEEIYSFVNYVVDKAYQEDKLDFFEMKISNHQGNLQKDHTLRDRKKVY